MGLSEGRVAKISNPIYTLIRKLPYGLFRGL
jgi:hypothetical protein